MAFKGAEINLCTYTYIQNNIGRQFLTSQRHRVYLRCEKMYKIKIYQSRP